MWELLFLMFLGVFFFQFGSLIVINVENQNSNPNLTLYFFGCILIFLGTFIFITAFHKIEGIINESKYK